MIFISEGVKTERDLSFLDLPRLWPLFLYDRSCLSTFAVWVYTYLPCLPYVDHLKRTSIVGSLSSHIHGLRENTYT